MGTTYLSFGQFNPRDGAPVFVGTARTESLSTSGANAASSATAQAGEIVKIVAASAATNGVVVNCGAAATATVGMFITKGETDWLIPLPGQSINVIEV